MTIWAPNLEERSGPRYIAIAEALAHDVRDGALPPGSRLPTHRELARVLGVTVGTVSRAYAEAERRGLVSGRVGCGTFVRERGVEEEGEAFGLPDWPGTSEIDLSLNLPASPDLAAEDDALASALAVVSSRPGLGKLLHYHRHEGLPRHREAAAECIGRVGMNVEPRRILICSGSQHALAVCFSTLTKPGEVVLTESLTYVGMKALANGFHFRLHGVAMDEFGMLPQAFAAACESTGAKLLYCVPTIQNPTAAVMPEARRKEIARIARHHGVMIIEDDIHGLLLPEPLPPISSFAPDHSCYIASLSKSMAPGLRISYVATSEEMVERLRPGLWITTWMAAPLMAEIATVWMQNGTADRMLEMRREEAAIRQKIAARALDGLRYQAHPFGYHLWLQLPEPWRAEDFIEQASKRGVAVTSPNVFVVERGSLPHAVRVCLGAVRSRERLAQGLETLSQILAQAPEPSRCVV
ncbi:MAG TPA: PLP-dependent aminotransferase family protein [Vicinamibacteria bacterium]|jgi:DNA-binding transcriptional MocR family regulator